MKYMHDRVSDKGKVVCLSNGRLGGPSHGIETKNFTQNSGHGIVTKTVHKILPGSHFV